MNLPQKKLPCVCLKKTCLKNPILAIKPAMYNFTKTIYVFYLLFMNCLFNGWQIKKHYTSISARCIVRGSYQHNTSSISCFAEPMFRLLKTKLFLEFYNCYYWNQLPRVLFLKHNRYTLYLHALGIMYMHQSDYVQKLFKNIKSNQKTYTEWDRTINFEKNLLKSSTSVKKVLLQFCWNCMNF